MRGPDENGWASSAGAWLARMPEQGDFAREFILDAPMKERVRASGASSMLDVGCGDGRFCRMAASLGVAATGIDPVPDFVAHARSFHPEGTYVQGFPETLPFPDQSFDLVVFYMSLIDIDGFSDALTEATRVLSPSGRILIANLSSFATSNGTIGRITDTAGNSHFPLGDYLTPRPDWVAWDGLRVRNWHRPLSAYMAACLDLDLRLTLFSEPTPSGCSDEAAARYAGVPYCMVMEWQKL